MIIRILPLAAVSIALAACDSSPPASESGDNLSMEEVAERAQNSSIKPEPGQYRVSMEVLEVDLPGLPPEAADMMKQNMDGQTHQYCLRQEDVDKGFEEMARQGQRGDCSFSRFDVADGDLDAEMTCNVDGQGTMTMTLNGTGTPTRSVMEMTVKGNPAGMGEMTMRTKSVHERIGDCG